MPVPSRELALGSRLPWFSLHDLNGAEHSAADIAVGQPIVVAFICNHSPYVLLIEDVLATTLNEFRAAGLYVIAISPNDVISYPSDGIEEMCAQAARGVEFEFPYCLDVTQEAAKAFQASCTPEFFVYDRDRRLVYHGQFDDRRPSMGGSKPITGETLIDAVTAVQRNEVVRRSQVASLGCSVKWRSGNEPDYVLDLPPQDWIAKVQ